MWRRMNREEFIKEIRDCMINRLSMKLRKILCKEDYDACLVIVKAAEEELNEICKSHRKSSPG